MRSDGRNLDLLGRAAPVLRLLTASLAALALAIAEQPLDTNITVVGAAYFACVILSVLLARRLDTPWLAFADSIIDIAAIAALTALAPAVTLPLWVLYVSPIASAAAIDPRAAAVAAGLSAVGYLVTRWFAAQTLDVSSLWPVATLILAALLAISPSVHILAERRAKRGWQEIAASLRAITGTHEAQAAASAVVEQVHRLVHADRVWLWWCDGDNRVVPFDPTKNNAEAVAAPPLQDCLTPALAARLKHASLPLSELGEPFSTMSGELMTLDQGEGPIAYLAVGWRQTPSDLAVRRSQLRILAPSMAISLARARELATLKESLRRGGVLLQTALELVDTLDLRVAREAAVNAARSALGGPAALVALPSGNLILGDQQIAEATANSDVQEQLLRSLADNASTSSSQNGLAVAAVHSSLGLAVGRTESPLHEEEVGWLVQLAALLGAADDRCAEHDRLRAEENRLRTSVEALPAPCAIWGPNGHLIIANQAYKSLGHPKLMPASRHSLASVYEEEIVAGDPPRTFVAMTAPVAETRCVVSVLREITQEREALRAKDELIAMAGHELRSPLTSISGYSQMMARQLAVVQRQVTQINSLIGDFLEASQLDGAQLRLATESVDLAELANMAAERFQGSNEGRRLRLELSEVPLLEGDATRLAQVLDNLLSNAAKYSPSEEEIVLTVKSDDRQVLVSVRDHGVGIAPEHLPRLFDRFYRVRNQDTEKVKGLGLGLSIVRDIVTAHGGRVWVESAGSRQGSTFWVSLPLPQAEQSEPRLEPTGTGN